MHTSLLHLKRVHMIGIKGNGMAALAEFLVQNGVAVTGSDTDEQFHTDASLAKLGIRPETGFSRKHLPKQADLVIYSTAYTSENEEVAAALAGQTPVKTYPEAIGMLTEEYLTLAVCGTHGKTTTSALLAHALQELGQHPAAIVGSRIREWEGSALYGRGKHLVLEADEYQNKLAAYAPFAAILTSVDWDHPDFFPTPEGYVQVFRDFVAKIPNHGVLVVCYDDADASQVAQAAHAPLASYGFFEGADYRITEYRAVEHDGTAATTGVKQTFQVMCGDDELGEFSLSLAGRHNAQNATAVIALCHRLRLLNEETLPRLKKALRLFQGTARRFEYLGERFGALIYDDYAHHPQELKVTLHAFRELYPKRRITGIFHPHTFSRTKALLSDFSQSFEDLDHVFVLPIYGSAREQQGGVSARELVEGINRFAPGKAVLAEESYEDLVTELAERMGRNDLVVTLGAGDVWQISHQLAKKKD